MKEECTSKHCKDAHFDSTQRDRLWSVEVKCEECGPSVTFKRGSGKGEERKATCEKCGKELLRPFVTEGRNVCPCKDQCRYKHDPTQKEWTRNKGSHRAAGEATNQLKNAQVAGQGQGNPCEGDASRVGGEERMRTIDGVSVTFCDYGVHGHIWQNDNLLKVNMPDRSEIMMVPLTSYEMYQTGPSRIRDEEKKAIFEVVGAGRKAFPKKVIHELEENKRGVSVHGFSEGKCMFCLDPAHEQYQNF